MQGFRRSDMGQNIVQNRSDVLENGFRLLFAKAGRRAKGRIMALGGTYNTPVIVERYRFYVGGADVEPDHHIRT